MAKKSVRLYVEKEVDMIIDKTVGKTQIEAYVDPGAVWIILTSKGNKDAGGTSADKRISACLTKKELTTLLDAFSPAKKEKE